MTENKEKILQELNCEIKNRLEEFRGLQDVANANDLILDERISSNIELFLKEIKDISLISVTAAPFSLTILLSGLNISTILLSVSFVIFMLNVLFLNIATWYINNEFFRSTSSQKLDIISMGIAADDINNGSLENNRRVNALFDFFKNKDKLDTKKKLEPYKQVRLVDKIRFIGIVLLSLAIFFLTISIVLPILQECFI